MHFVWHSLFPDLGFNAAPLIIDFSRQADYNVLLSANPMHFFLSPNIPFFRWARLSSCRKERDAFLLAKGHILLTFFFLRLRVSLWIGTRLLHLRWASSFGLVSLELDSMRACVHEIYPDVTTREVWICPILITMETLNSAVVTVPCCDGKSDGVL